MDTRAAAPPVDRVRLVAFLADYPPDALLRAVRAERARRSLYEFFRQAFAEVIEPTTALEDGPHIAAICDHVQWQLEERARVAADPANAAPHPCLDVLINIPPRCLKSLIVQVAAVAWAWLRWPTLRVLCLSANPRVSTESSDKCRALIRSEWYQTSFAPTWQIREDKDGVTSFGNTAGGQRVARGWESNVVGEGADWRIVDDPDDPDDVHSDLVRKGVERRWQNSIANRKTDPRTTITTALQQRCHHDDWSSNRIREGWIVVVLPMEFEPEHPIARPTPMPVDELGRYAPGGARTWRDWRTVAGAVLHPRFSPEFLRSERTRLGSYGYAGQMQQRPAPTEGGMFKRVSWRYFVIEGEPRGPHPRPQHTSDAPTRTLRPRDLNFLAITVDATFGKTAGADNVGLAVIGGVGADRFVFHDETRQMTIVETMASIRRLREAYPAATCVLVERKANGQAVIDQMTAEISGMVGIDPEGGKISRAAGVSPSVEAGNWYLLEGASWLSEWVEEWAAFPNGKHDDRVDAGTQLAIYYADKGWSAVFEAAYR